MSNLLPNAPIPPPPTILPLPQNWEVIKQATSTALNKKPQLEECLWALDYPELQKACFLARICADIPPVKCEFHNIGSILQVGPTCGLTALSMLLGGIPPADQLLSDAKKKHFTNNGEMFSAHNLYELICDNLATFKSDHNNNNNNNANANGTDTDQLKKQTTSTTSKVKHSNVIECQMHEGRLNCAKVRENLQQGACIFVPYPLKKKLDAFFVFTSANFVWYYYICFDKFLNNLKFISLSKKSVYFVIHAKNHLIFGVAR